MNWFSRFVYSRHAIAPAPFARKQFGLSSGRKVASVYPNCANGADFTEIDVMDYDQFVSDMPSDRTIVFTSVEEMEEGLQREGIYQPTRQLEKGQFRSQLAVSHTKHADLVSVRYSTAVSMHVEPPVGTVGLLFPRTVSGKFIASGENVGNDKLLVFDARSGVDIVGPALVGSEDIAISAARFGEMIEVLAPNVTAVEGESLKAGNTAELLALRDSVANLVAHPELDPSGERVTNLVSDTIAWIGDSNSPWGSESLSVSVARIHVARTARDYIEANYRVPVHIEDICRVTSVGVRTVQRCFREYFDLTVSDYLKSIRLGSAHRELAAANPSETTVTRIAMDNGCDHLGRFSVEFHERFGELPSQMLARQAGKK